MPVTHKKVPIISVQLGSICLCAIDLIQNDTPTREMLPLKMRILSMFSKRNHLQSLFLIR